MMLDYWSRKLEENSYIFVSTKELGAQYVHPSSIPNNTFIRTINNHIPPYYIV